MSKVRARNRKRQITKRRKRVHKLKALRGKYMAAKGKSEQEQILKKIQAIAPFYPVEGLAKEARSES